MAALSQTPANVAIGASSTITRRVQYGEAITQGQPLYENTDGKYYQCDANDGVAKSRCGAIALTPGGIDAYGIIAVPGSTPGQCTINLGATLAVGTTYSVGQTKGSIVPNADLTTNDWVCNIGVAISTSLLDFQVQVSNIQKA